ncbi:MAG: oligosaccharide repeat unit polymerase [Prevotella sp.]|nr:oligosaccharide repeat unit polymerase [Prevotella sp.]
MVVICDFIGDGGVLFDYDIVLSPIATLLYCFFITLGILPFSMLYKKDLTKISATNPIIPLAVSIFLISVAFLNLYLVADSTLEILSGDLATIKFEHNTGFKSPAEIKAEGLPVILKFLYFFKSSTLLAIPLFFYYFCFDKKPWWFLVLLFFASLTSPIYCMQMADRTEVVFYAMMFLSCIILFHKFLSSKARTLLRFSVIPIAIIMFIYLAAVTDARFGDRNEGSTGGVAQYSGQNYLNFCYFWEYGNFNYMTTEREFPLITYILLHKDNTDDRRNERASEQGFQMSVFASYIGDIMLDLSPLGMVIWCTLFFLITVVIFKRPHRTEYTLGEYLMYFYLSAIPIFGIFYYRYMVLHYTLMLFVALTVYVTDKFKFVISKEENAIP